MTTPTQPKSNESHFIVTVGGIPYPFAVKTGGEVSGDVTKVFDGGATAPDLIPGRRLVGDLIISAPYARARDQAQIDRLMSRVLVERQPISIQPTDSDYIVDGDPMVYPDCLLMRVTPPNVNAGGSDAATWEMAWSAPRPPARR